MNENELLIEERKRTWSNFVRAALYITVALALTLMFLALTLL